MKETDEPAATETVVVPLPLFPLTLQRRFLSDRSVTGLLLGTGLMFWKRAPLAPLAVRYSKMSFYWLVDVSFYTAMYRTVRDRKSVV